MAYLNYGLSGCTLEIIDHSIIRKWSSNHNYNTRLYAQAIKQEIKSIKQYNTFAIPKIKKINTTDLFYFDMEYIHCKSFNEYFYELSPYAISKFIQFIDEYFASLSPTDKYSSDEIKYIILQKISSLNHSNYTNFIVFLEKKVKSIYFSPTYKEVCHGDLTMSNILFTDEKYYLIDFLDSYFESGIIDLVKLKQDLYYHWILKINNITNLKAYQISSHIWKCIENKYINNINTDLFKILEIINWLRIEPYIKNNNYLIILDNIIKENKLYHEFNNSHCR